MNINPDRIIGYIRSLPPETLGLTAVDDPRIIDMTPGSYNLNYHILVGGAAFNFRVNIDQQSGLANQIEHEFKVLTFLEDHGIAPKGFLYDDSRRHFDFDILIQSYLDGPHLLFNARDVKDAAALLAALHALDPVDKGFTTWHDPLRDTQRLVAADLAEYTAKKSADPENVHLVRKALAVIEKKVAATHHRFVADSLNHTDVAMDNFIRTRNGLRMVDWEKPRVDDGTYDLGCFLSKPVQLWCSETILDKANEDAFVRHYAACRGLDPDLLAAKIALREPLISLHWVLWGGGKLCDLKDRTTSPALLAAHSAHRPRYERISHPANIKEILRRL